METTMTWTTEALADRKIHRAMTTDGTFVVVHENAAAGTVTVTMDPIVGDGVVFFGGNFATADEAKATVEALENDPAVESYDFEGSHVRFFLAPGFWLDGRRTDYACQISAVAGVLENRVTKIEQ